MPIRVYLGDLIYGGHQSHFNQVQFSREMIDSLINSINLFFFSNSEYIVEFLYQFRMESVNEIPNAAKISS